MTIFNYASHSVLEGMTKVIRTLSDCGRYRNMLAIAESMFKYLLEKYRIAGSDL